jgi:rare lipoprotein A
MRVMNPVTLLHRSGFGLLSNKTRSLAATPAVHSAIRAAGIRALCALSPLFLVACTTSLPLADQAAFTAPPAGYAAHAERPRIGLQRADASSRQDGMRLAEPARRNADESDNGDSVAPAEAPATYTAPRYSLAEAFASYRQKGVASWYGKEFHGKRTSSGDPFDMYALTAAHPSLPIPSYVRVTNLANGRSAVVRVNDRGPYHPGRIIDLSYAAAYKLGFSDQGQANVEVALVLPEDIAFVNTRRPVPPLRHAALKALPAAPVVVAATPAAITPSAPLASLPPASASLTAHDPQPGARPAGEVFLQLGSFPSLLNAEQFKAFVEHELRALTANVFVLSTGGKHLLNVGPFPSAQDASTMAERIAQTLKIKPFVIQR